VTTLAYSHTQPVHLDLADTWSDALEAEAMGVLRRVMRL
jgi:hypothetical protein